MSSVPTALYRLAADVISGKASESVKVELSILAVEIVVVVLVFVSLVGIAWICINMAMGA